MYPLVYQVWLVVSLMTWLCPGGSMPSIISTGLINLTGVSWSRVHFFFCDERVVPYNDPASTFGVYNKTLFSQLPVTPYVHKIDLTAPTTEACAAGYQQDVLEYFGVENGYAEFDLLLLGLGPDGHTCSLFPRHALLEVYDCSFLVPYVPNA